MTESIWNSRGKSILPISVGYQQKIYYINTFIQIKDAIDSPPDVGTQLIVFVGFVLKIDNNKKSKIMYQVNKINQNKQT